MLASRVTILPSLPNQEKAVKRLEELFNDLEFTFTEITAVTVQPNGKRENLYGTYRNIENLKNSIKTIHWLHSSSYRGRWYALVTFQDNRYGYIRCHSENFWSNRNSLRFYVGNSHVELIQYAMRTHVYKSLRKQFIP